MSTSRTVDFRYAPHRVWTAICRPDDPHKSIVDDRGRLLYDYRHNTTLDTNGELLVDFTTGHFQRALSFHIQIDRPPLSVTQSTLSGRVPIVRTIVKYDQAILELLTFTHLHDIDRRTDVVLWTIRTDKPSFMTNFQIQAQGFGQMGFRKVPQGGSLVEAKEGAAMKPVLLSTAELSGGAAFDDGPTPAFRTPRALVTPDAPFSGAVMIPLNHQQVDHLDLSWAQHALKAEEDFWNHTSLSPLRLEVPDDGIMQMLASCARNILQAREIKQGIPEFQVGASIYRGLWIVDGYFLLEAAQYLGHAHEAFHGLDALLKRVQPDGSIGVTPTYLKETAVVLKTFVRQCELMDDSSKLTQLWPTVKRAIAYLDSLREKSKENGPDAPEYGLLPTAFGDGGIGGKRPEYTNALWILAGLKAVADAAQRLGLADDAAHVRASYDSLMQSFRQHAARDLRTLEDGTPYLPMVMPDSGSAYIFNTADPTAPPPGIPAHPWDRITPATATWSLAHAIYPGEVFATDDPLVTNFCHLLDLIDDEQGIPAGTGWAPYQAIWNYSASFYAHVWLYTGHPQKAIDYLYAFANHASPTRAWREEQAFRSAHHGYWVGDMPHNWASAEFIRLVRHMLVLERGQRLELLPALPAQWIIPGKSVVVERTPTRFGPVTLELHFHDSTTAKLTYTCNKSGSHPAQECIVHVDALKRAGIKQLTLNGRAVSLDQDTIAL